MKNTVVITVSLLATMFSGMVVAHEVSDASIHRLLTLNGISKQVSQLPDMLQMGMEQSRDEDKARNNNHSVLSDKVYDDMVKTMRATFKTDEILQIIATKVKHKVSEEDAKKMLLWYESDLGRRITKAEEDASTPAGYRAILSTSQSLLKDKQRVQFAQKLDRLLHLTDMNLELQEKSTFAVSAAVQAAINPDKPINSKELKSKVAALFKKARPNMERIVILSLVYTYKDFDMTSLNKYLAFLGTDRYLRFDKYLRIGMAEGLEISLGEMTQAVMATVKHDVEQKKKVNI